MPDRVAQVGDLWSDMQRRGYSLTQPMDALKRMMS